MCVSTTKRVATFTFSFFYLYKNGKMFLQAKATVLRNGIRASLISMSGDKKRGKYV